MAGAEPLVTDDPFMTDETEPAEDELPPVIEAQFHGRCPTCDAWIAPGDRLRADGFGGWECADHAG